MAIRYYDEVLAYKIKKWIPENSTLRVLKPDETKRLFETKADDSNDAPIKLPIVSLSRSNDIELLLNIKNSKSFDGLKLSKGSNALQINSIPIKLNYQLDIWTKDMEEGDEYLRNFLFKLINNPVIKISFPYQGVDVEHIANIRVLSTISDTSDVAEHLFPGQFTRWSIQLEIQDAFFFNIPARKKWKIIDVDVDTNADLSVNLDISKDISTEGDIEVVYKKEN